MPNDDDIGQTWTDSLIPYGVCGAEATFLIFLLSCPNLFCIIENDMIIKSCFSMKGPDYETSDYLWYF